MSEQDDDQAQMNEFFETVSFDDPEAIPDWRELPETGASPDEDNDEAVEPVDPDDEIEPVEDEE